MAHKGQDVEWWDRELERRDKSSTSTFEGSGDDDADDVGFYDGREDDEDFDAEGSGHFIPEVVGDFGEGSGNSDDGDVDEDAEKPPKVNEPWRPWSKEEIEVIESTTTTTTSTEKPKSTSGAARGTNILDVVQLSILLLLSCLVASRRSL